MIEWCRFTIQLIEFDGLFSWKPGPGAAAGWSIFSRAVLQTHNWSNGVVVYNPFIALRFGFGWFSRKHVQNPFVWQLAPPDRHPRHGQRRPQLLRVGLSIPVRFPPCLWCSFVCIGLTALGAPLRRPHVRGCRPVFQAVPTWKKKCRLVFLFFQNVLSELKSMFEMYSKCPLLPRVRV